MEEDAGKQDDVLDLVMYYCLHGGSYPDGLLKQKKRGMCERAAKLATENGENFFVEERKKG